MNRNARIQLYSAIGIALAVPALYLALQSGAGWVAQSALMVFGACILTTPAMKLSSLVRRRTVGATEPAEAAN